MILMNLSCMKLFFENQWIVVIICNPFTQQFFEEAPRLFINKASAVLIHFHTFASQKHKLLTSALSISHWP